MNVHFAAAVFAAVVSTSSAALAADATRQGQVERNSEKVMPFSMHTAKHFFLPTATGGVQTVLVHGGNRGQIHLVRSHLRKEAAAFARGDFTDPASIHGGAMPGLQALRADNVASPCATRTFRTAPKSRTAPPTPRWSRPCTHRSKRR